MKTYMIVRVFMRNKAVVIKRGCTLAQVREHCGDPETSSKTCKAPELVTMTEEMGPWFDGYEEESCTTQQ